VLGENKCTQAKAKLAAPFGIYDAGHHAASESLSARRIFYRASIQPEDRQPPHKKTAAHGRSRDASKISQISFAAPFNTQRLALQTEGAL
jgi:hypothetical protein